MRTVPCSGRLGRGVSPQDVYTLCQVHAFIHTLSHLDRMTDACENITFLQLLLRTVKKKLEMGPGIEPRLLA